VKRVAISFLLLIGVLTADSRPLAGAESGRRRRGTASDETVVAIETPAANGSGIGKGMTNSLIHR
jgi:hypothetical protein